MTATRIAIGFVMLVIATTVEATPEAATWRRQTLVGGSTLHAHARQKNSPPGSAGGEKAPRLLRVRGSIGS